jgi:hypothetical protein
MTGRKSHDCRWDYRILDRYFAPISGPVMVTAANIIGGAVKIARAKPALTERIVSEILKVEKVEAFLDAHEEEKDG